MTTYYDTNSHISPTDGREPIYLAPDKPYEGYDICGRKILHRDGRPGKAKAEREAESKDFRRAMANYRKRTGLKLNVQVWSFIEEDLV